MGMTIVGQVMVPQNLSRLDRGRGAAKLASLFFAILLQTFSPYSVAEARIGSVGEVVPEETSHA
jgi:hypothetical protein